MGDTLTDRVVRDAVAISSELAYLGIFHKGEWRSLLVRPYGARGDGIWVWRVLPGPKISPAWQPPAAEASP